MSKVGLNNYRTELNQETYKHVLYPCINTHISKQKHSHTLMHKHAHTDINEHTAAQVSINIIQVKEYVNDV